jgi:choline dehydrogenase-like flavoprotein
MSAHQFDVIVVGSGAGGASVARELSCLGKRVLVIERGHASIARDGLRYLASVSDYVPVTDEAGMARALTTGGTTALYFGVAEFPPIDTFKAMGIDLTEAVAKVRHSLPLATPVADRLLGAQTLRVAASAAELGVPWAKVPAMLIDQDKCGPGYTPAAIWRAQAYLDQAVAAGARLITSARVRKVLVEGGRAVGVEYEDGPAKRRVTRQAYARRVILAAGALATPQLLRDSGLANVGQHGFYCDPAFFVIGHVDGLKGGDLFPGCMGTVETDGLILGDGCLSRTLYRGSMLAARQWRKLLRHRSHVGVGVMVRDGLGGALGADGRLHKRFTGAELAKLEQGAALATRIVENAGAKGVFRTGLSAAHVGGVLALGTDLDADLQTGISHLHVCDSSLLPVNVRLTPVVTLVSLGHYLAQRLALLL